jgi:UDP:flavonoid glycosyltransferase YjiC (YdhE family)
MPFIEACRGCGEETLVAGPPWLADMAEAQGYDFVAFPAPSREVLRELRSSLRHLPKQDQDSALRREGYGRIRPQASLPVLIDACSHWHPDVVIREAAEFGSALASEQHEIPVVRVTWLASFEDRIIRLCAQPLDELRRAAGLPADPEGERIRHSPAVTFWPSALEDLSHAPLPKTLRFRDTRWDAPAGELSYEWAEPHRPLVYVTFGTVTGSLDIASQVYTTAVEALSDLPVRAVLTAGQPQGTPPLVAELPAHVRAEAWISEQDVLAEAALVVCHGGASSILGAAAVGIPLVIVPLFGDQHANARRVAEFGAGVTTELDAESVRNAVLEVLRSDTYHRRAQALARELRAHAPCERIVELLAELSAGTTGAVLG